MAQSNFGIPYATKTGGNGGVNFYEQRHTSQGWAKPDPVRRSTECVVAGGQVIPAWTWLMLRDDGKVIPHNGFIWSQVLAITADVTAAKTLILTDSVSLTPNTVTVNVAKGTVDEAIDAILADDGFNTFLATVGMSAFKQGSLIILAFNHFTNAGSALTLTGTITATLSTANNGTAGQVTGNTASLQPIAGLMAYDVCAFDASGNGIDTHAQMFVAGSRYNTSVRWASGANEMLTDAWGVSHAVSAYNTGVTNMIAANAFCVQSDFEIRETREV